MRSSSPSWWDSRVLDGFTLSRAPRCSAAIARRIDLTKRTAGSVATSRRRSREPRMRPRMYSPSITDKRRFRGKASTLSTMTLSRLLVLGLRGGFAAGPAVDTGSESSLANRATRASSAAALPGSCRYSPASSGFPSSACLPSALRTPSKVSRAPQTIAAEIHARKPSKPRAAEMPRNSQPPSCMRASTAQSCANPPSTPL
mmetsp:Transcript_14988/g.56864  ORF Transcript_14988/g.56864 Transcript_14988/m.56864 type:complete len:201 (-) Transcript_14988:283-885(-)